MNIDWRRIQNKKIIYLREDPSLLINCAIIRAIRNLWNLTSLNSIRDKRDSKRNRIYFITKKKRSSAITVEKLNTSNKIVDSNNISYSNIFRESYR